MSKADKKEAKKTKRKKEEEALGRFRRREGFIPYYSDMFFERRKNFWAQFTGWLFLILFFVALAMTECDLGKTLVAYLIMVCLFLIYRKVRIKVENKMKSFGYQMGEDALTLMVWGRQEIIPYVDIQRVLMTTPVKMTIKALKVPMPQGYISFHYEVGNSKQQRHIIECYDALVKKVKCPMPEMMKKNITYFDKMYTYNKSFRNWCIVFAVVEFWLFAVGVSKPDGPGVIALYVVIAIIQWVALSTMAKSIRLGIKNAAELQERLTKYPRTTYQLKNRKTWQFIAVAILVIALNLGIVCYWWM